MTLTQLRNIIKRERKNVDKKSFSHNIISLVLNIILTKYGKEVANKAVRDFKLKKLGWKEE